MYPSVEYVVYVIEQSAGQGPAMVLISAMSVFIAAAALYFSIQHIRDERKHKILMVKPKVIIQVVSPEPNKRGMTLSIINCGLGPAILHKIEYAIDGKLVDNFAHIRLGTLLRDNAEQDFLFNSPARDQHLPAQGVYTLAYLDCDIYQADIAKSKIQKQLDIRITYSSVYEEQFVTEL